jgi:hypothetical protein
MITELVKEQALPLSGMFLLVWAYFIVFRNPARQSSFAYIWMNIIGSAILSAYAVYRREPMFFGIEFFWMAISILSLVRKVRRR